MTTGSTTLLPDSAKKTSSYIPSLDGFRALAFLFVFGSHTLWYSIGHYFPVTFGVTVFFFLSGYLITGLLRTEIAQTGTISLRDFYIRRSLRIFFPMYVAYGVAALFAFFSHRPAGDLFGFSSAIFYFYNYASLLSSHAAPVPGMTVVWSLCVEEHFYLVFPILYLVMTRSGLVVKQQRLVLLALCAACLGWRTFVATHSFPEYWTSYATDCRFDSILAGAVLAIWNNPHLDPPSPFLRRYNGPIAAAALLALVLTRLSSTVLYQHTLRDTLQCICLYFIFYFAIFHSSHWSVAWLQFKPVRYIGWLSYSLYLIHLPIFLFIHTHLPKKDWIVGSLCFLLAFAYAFMVRHAVELPLQKLRKRFRHTPAPIAPDVAVEGI